MSTNPGAWGGMAPVFLASWGGGQRTNPGPLPHGVQRSQDTGPFVWGGSVVSLSGYLAHGWLGRVSVLAQFLGHHCGIDHRHHVSLCFRSWMLIIGIAQYYVLWGRVHLAFGFVLGLSFLLSKHGVLKHSLLHACCLIVFQFVLRCHYAFS